MSDQDRNPREDPIQQEPIGMEIDWEQYGRQSGYGQEGNAAASPSAWQTDPAPAGWQAGSWEEVPPADPAAEDPSGGYQPAEEGYAAPQEAGGAYVPQPEDWYPRQPDPQPEPPRPPRRRKVRSLGITFLVAVLYVVSVLAISLFAATLGWRWSNDLLALNKEDHTASVVIQAGDTMDDVAQKLKDSGLIEYPILFEVFASFTGKADSITSGTYELNTDMDYAALLTNISQTSSVREEVTVTIPEGYTVKEIFQLLENQGACTVEKLEYSALHDDYSDYPFLEGLKEEDDPYWMEGYLFPDTYQFYKDGDAKLVLAKMLYNYSQKFDSEMKVRAQRLGYTQEEIMIVASIIEKETDGQDQRDIASVIYNRLDPENNETLGRLQMDSTIQYILEERKERLTEEDLQIESPYNTYRNEGLPAGAICNPGIDSINAALYPNSTTYYYFILGNDGTTHFFSDYDAFSEFRDQVSAGTDVSDGESDEEEE